MINDSTKTENKPTKDICISNGTIQELLRNKSLKNLFVVVDASSMVFFRIIFGCIMLFEVTRYLNRDWIAKYWIEPQYHFTYWPFDFLQPLSGNGMYYLFYLMGFLSVCIIIGFLYRLSMILFFFSFSYVFLLEQTRYMNHFYLVILILFTMIFVPANKSLSVDSKIFKNNASETIPVWSLWLMRFMIALPYFFGGIAKINADWLQGQPLKIWLSYKSDFPIIGSWFHYDWMAIAMAYAGLILDLFIVPALLFKKTRTIGFMLIVMFHLMNSRLFSIGIFPWFMIAATCLYFNPDWFRKLINFIIGNKWKFKFDNMTANSAILSGKEKLISYTLLLWVVFHIIIPIRHIFIPGTVHWTEEGHRYSWHMKLRTKSSYGDYLVVDKKTGIKEIINPRNYLTGRQYNKIGDRPYLVWQFCQIIKKDYKKHGKDVAVYANIKSTLNGRNYQQLIDSTVDLASEPRPFFPVKWIVPLHTPLEDQMKIADDDTNGD